MGGKFPCRRYSVGWSRDLVPERWKRRTESQTTGERPLHKPQWCRNNFIQNTCFFTTTFLSSGSYLSVSVLKKYCCVRSHPSVVFSGAIIAPPSSWCLLKMRPTPLTHQSTLLTRLAASSLSHRCPQTHSFSICFLLSIVQFLLLTDLPFYQTKLKT